jgi:hypothetical protein
MWAHNANCVDTVKPGAFAFLNLGENEFVKALRARLFHTLETKAKVYGKRLVEGMMSVENVNPTKNGTLVIG